MTDMTDNELIEELRRRMCGPVSFAALEHQLLRLLLGDECRESILNSFKELLREVRRAKA
jgi:hypothetical protein